MDIAALKTFLQPSMDEVVSLMRSSLGSGIALLDETNRSLMDHAGKMMRPVLSLLVGGACGRVNGDTIRYAAASELLHNATLLHDDVVDGAPERRGCPTVKSLLNSPASVLIGDFWLVKAMQCILDASRSSDQVIRFFSKTLSDLAEGEMLQLQKASSCDTTEEDYLRIVYCKTASLFEAASRGAAVSVDAPEETVEAMGAYGRNLGIAFQIRDDMFDYMPSGPVGKPVGVDLEEQKITMPLLCALSQSPRDEAAIREKVRMIATEPALAGEVRAFVEARGGVALAGQKADFYIGKAVEALAVLPESAEKSYLAQLARFVGERTY